MYIQFIIYTGQEISVTYLPEELEKKQKSLKTLSWAVFLG